MTRRFVEQLADGDTVDDVFLVVDKQLRANRNGNLYIQLDLGDRSGTINARMWNAGEPLYKSFEPGDFLQVKGKVQLFQGSLQLIANTLERHDATRVELTDFLPHTKHDISKLLERLKAAVRKVSDPHLRALAESYFIDDAFMRAFARCPAGVKVHHAYVGGLLEHVVTMMDVADRVLPLYPEVNRDLVVMGVFLHDSGKVRELSFARTFAYSDEGQLLGHLTIGIEMLADKARLVPDLTGEPFPPDLLLRLKHLILSHHGEAEFGSPKVPMTPEAVALHAIDLMDSRIHIAVREIADDRGESAWTPYNAAMGRRLYKGPRPAAAAADGTD
jgi:3'-5' exoribonuclease